MERKQKLKRFRTVPRKVLKHRFIRYFFSAGAATAVDIFSYFIMFNMVLEKMPVSFLGSLISAPIFSLLVSYSLGLITNFTITKYFVFQESDLRGRYQLMRYLLVAALVFVANYFLLKFFVEFLEIYPTPSRILSAGIVAVCSFYMHKLFTFRIKKVTT